MFLVFFYGRLIDITVVFEKIVYFKIIYSENIL